MRILLLGLIIVGALLFVSNPSPAELREHLSERIMAQLAREVAARGSDGEGVEAVGRLFVPAIVSALTIERRNFVVFSIYKISGISGKDAPVPPCILAAGKQFIAMNSC